MVSIIEIKRALESLECESGNKGLENLEMAIVNLKAVNDALNTVSVRGRNSVDALLGCMMGIDLIIGKEGDNG